MLRFINGDDTQWQWLREQMQGMLYTFEQIQLPQQICTPNITRVGFEYTPQNGYVIYIDKGIVYTGKNVEFKKLLEDGEKRFESFEDLTDYIKSLKPLFEENQAEFSNIGSAKKK